jgi:hypothetical protein
MIVKIKMNGTMKKTSIFICCLLLSIGSLSARELLPLGSDRDFPVNAPADARDTVAGYPIYVDGDGWRYASVYMGRSTGFGAINKLPSVNLIKVGQKGLTYFSSTTVNYGRSSSGGWRGEPCKGDFIVLINEIRGMLDRCAHASVKQMQVQGVNSNVLVIASFETNTNARYYSHETTVFLDSLGLSPSQFIKGSPFEGQARQWLQQFLRATVRAAESTPDLNAFTNLPSLAALVEGAASPISKENSNDLSGMISIDPNTGEATAKRTERTPSGNLELRLLKLKRLFEEGLITESEYKELRQKALKEL